LYSPDLDLKRWTCSKEGRFLRKGGV
jgi:hypothetical protein